MQLVKAEEVIDNTYKIQFRNIKITIWQKCGSKSNMQCELLVYLFLKESGLAIPKKRATIQTKSRGKERGWGEVLCPEQGSLFLAVSVA